MPVRPDLLHFQLQNAGLPVTWVSSDGSVGYTRELTSDEQTTATQIIAAHDPFATPLWEEDETISRTSRVDFRKLPEWATLTPTEGRAYVQSGVLQGWTKAQSDAWIDANVTNLATAISALKVLAGAIIDLRNIVSAIASAVILIRNVVIRRFG